MDPIRNPYAPGAGQRPPELAGRDSELQAFEVVLERIRRGRPERSVVLTGLRGVGKTVLLGALRSAAVRQGWGTGKVEARPEVSLRRQLSAALHLAIRELGPQVELGERDQALGVLKSFALRDAGPQAKLRDRWHPGIEVAAVAGRADSGDLEIDLVELFTDLAGFAADSGRAMAIFIDELQDVGPVDISALCAACHELSQQRLPLIVVGAGLPHLPAVLTASKSYSERLFRYAKIDRLDRVAADLALTAPAEQEGADWTPQALSSMYDLTAGYPYFVQAYGKVAWDVAPAAPITADDVRVAGPEAALELGVGFFGSRYERATPGEREYLRAMAELEGTAEHDAERDLVPAVATAAVAEALARRPQSLSPARDGLLKKGLVFSSARGQIAFTVPHFGQYLRAQD